MKMITWCVSLLVFNISLSIGCVYIPHCSKMLPTLPSFAAAISLLTLPIYENERPILSIFF